jgi:4-azaleucine resistance transporter AzlC
MDNANKAGLKDGLSAALPVFIGYFPIAVTFGLMAVSMNITLWETMAFSVFVFAGASQFVGLGMIQAGIGAGEIGLTIFLLNFRHFLMSSSVASRTSFKKVLVPLIAFGITDETFAVSSLQEKLLTEKFMLALNFTAYTGWVSGTAAGYIAGDFLSPVLKESMAICLYAMFIAILVPQVKKLWSTGITAVIAGACNSLLKYMAWFSSGWNIIISILAACVIAYLFFRGEE